MKILRKPAFTLLETLIALAWTAILVVVMTTLFNQILKLNRETDRLQQEAFRMRYLENRLSQIFPRVVPANTSYKDFYFFTAGDPPGFIFTYDQGADKQKIFANHVLGRIFVDTEKRLTLLTWPSPSRWSETPLLPYKLEVLLEDIDDFSFEFFVPPDKNWTPKYVGDVPEKTKPDATNPSQPQPQKKGDEVVVKPANEGGWINEWQQQYKLLPGMVRIRLVSRGESYLFMFPLSQTQRQIVYTQ